MKELDGSDFLDMFQSINTIDMTNIEESSFYEGAKWAVVYLSDKIKSGEWVVKNG